MRLLGRRSARRKGFERGQSITDAGSTPARAEVRQGYSGARFGTHPQPLAAVQPQTISATGVQMTCSSWLRAASSRKDFASTEPVSVEDLG